MIYWEDRRVNRLRCGAGILTLTPTSAIIMDCLLRTPGQAVSSDRLADAVYAGRYEPEGPLNVVQVTICKLRRIGVPIRSRGRGSSDGYWLDRADVSFAVGERYTIDELPGTYTIKEVLEAPVVVFENDKLGEMMKSANDPILKNLRRVV